MIRICYERGQKIGQLTYLEDSKVHKYPRKAVFLCRCGKEFESYIKGAKNNSVTSCGCRKKAGLSPKVAFVDGIFAPEYEVWCGMKARCYNKRHRSYKNYGARGIGICDEWKHCFKRFLADMGRRPSKRHSIERYDNNIGYQPSNCRWATIEEQCVNRRNNRIVEFNGEKKCISQWAVIVGVKCTLIRTRLERGWPPEKALSSFKYKKGGSILR